MNDQMVKVPFKREVSGAKTLFLPDCRMTKGYEIGARHKDQVRGIQNYWDALEKLMPMSQARFRRRNRNGIFGTVTCEPGDVELVSRSFVESERVKYGG